MKGDASVLGVDSGTDPARTAVDDAADYAVLED